jgi:anti-sigma regulatory factor (Ser/Thr protein kinase)
MNAMMRVRVEDPSQVGEVRRRAASMSRELGFDDVRVEHVSIVVTELATNLVKHAGGGDLILHGLHTADSSAIEVLALDKGPGIGNIGESLGDGFSTTKSRGNGLGAIRRLSTTFDIYSKPGLGTAVLSIIRRQTAALRMPPVQTLEMGAVCLPVQTEVFCGDAWAMHQHGGRTTIVLADGLGHGEFAAEASRAAVTIFEQYPDAGPKELITRMHDALRSTRGATVAVAEVLTGQRLVRYAGVGNITTRVYSEEGIQNMISYNGTVGLEARKIEEFTCPWPENGLLIMFSDGVSANWNLDDYPGLRGRNASLIAGVLFRDFNRVRDDKTVLVMREARSEP